MNEGRLSIVDTTSDPVLRCVVISDGLQVEIQQHAHFVLLNESMIRPLIDALESIISKDGL